MIHETTYAGFSNCDSTIAALDDEPVGIIDAGMCVGPEEIT